MELNWYGWFSPYGGYGTVNLEYSCALERLTNGGVSIGWERYSERSNPFEWQILNDEERRLFNKPFIKKRVGVIKTTPLFFHKNISDIKIGYTMVENTQVGKEWVQHINRMDAVLVPSKYLVEVFKGSGVRIPIYPIKQGVNPLKYPFIYRKKKEKYIFATAGVQDERKNWKDLITAFSSEFAPEEPVELWIKNTNPDFGNIAFLDQRIKVINSFYSFDEMKQFYHMVDCFVFPSHAEGSGMPPKEAMATGLPVIMTNWSGLADICDSHYNYPIDPISIDYPEDKIRVNEQPGVQARIDPGELMFWMREVYKHQDEAKEKGKRASEWMMREYNWDTCAKELLEILKKYK